MGTLAGMPGPPLIIMFQILRVPKVWQAPRAVWRLRMYKLVSRSKASYRKQGAVLRIPQAEGQPAMQ